MFYTQIIDSDFYKLNLDGYNGFYAYSSSNMLSFKMFHIISNFSINDFSILIKKCASYGFVVFNGCEDFFTNNFNYICSLNKYFVAYCDKILKKYKDGVYENN